MGTKDPNNLLWFVPTCCGCNACNNAPDNRARRHDDETLGDGHVSGMAGRSPDAQPVEYPEKCAADKVHPKLKRIESWTIHGSARFCHWRTEPRFGVDWDIDWESGRLERDVPFPMSQKTTSTLAVRPPPRGPMSDICVGASIPDLRQAS